MPRVPDKTKQLMKEMYSSGLSVAEIARRANVPYSTAYGYTRARQRGFASYGEYEEHLARQRINPETGQLFKSLTELRDYQARQRQRRPENKELGDLMRTRLRELGKNQSWLAGQIGVTRATVSL